MRTIAYITKVLGVMVVVLGGFYGIGVLAEALARASESTVYVLPLILVAIAVSVFVFVWRKE